MKRKGNKQIPDEVRERVKILTAQGYSVRTISNRVSLGKNAVNKIQHEIDNLGQLRDIEKRKMAQKLWNQANRMFNFITDRKLQKTAASSLFISIATVIDKALLLVGDVTERVGLSMPEIDQRLLDIQEQRKILKQAQGVISRKGKQLQKDKADEKS